MTDDPARWSTLVAEAEREVRRWRRAHPEATLTEIEAVLDARLRAVRAGLLAELAAEAPPEPGRCPACEAALVRRGERSRTVRTHGEQELTLRRRYASCPACGAGLFPPR